MEARQTPTFSANLPNTKSTDGKDAADIAAAFFGKPLEWQRFVLDGLLARNRWDKYAAKVYAISIPRQNGKSWIVRARCFYGMVFCGEKILFTCQHGDTADEMFKALADVFEDEENEELHGLLKAVRRTNGQQAIYLHNGGCIRFTTRTNSLARGKTYDVLIYDEAQELTVAQQAASLPTISAGRLKNPQTIYLGTPPGPDNVGTVFATMHDDVHAGVSKAAWVEWSAEKVGSKYDVERWYETNPSLGHLLTTEAVEAESDSMPPDSFARERLGWWSPTAKTTTAISPALWDRRAIPAIGDAYRARKAFGLKFSPDGTRYFLAGCKLDAKGDAAVELVEIGTTENGTRPLASELVARADSACCTVVDGISGAAVLCDHMREMKAPKGYVVEANASTVISAASLVLDSLKDGTLSHSSMDGSQAELDDSATTSVKRPIGTKGGWGFGSADGHDSCAIEAASLALWGARNSKRRPGRKQRRI